MEEKKTISTADAGREKDVKDMFLNIGPAHPAMHGIIRIITELEGEVVRKAEIEIGYLHRCFEKDSEHVSWNGVMPYTDRLNYVSAMLNNFGYCRAVEKLMDLQVPERALYIRTIMGEISRVADHLTCIGASAMELGAFTAFLYFMQAREYLYELIEDACGARITNSYGRIGGVRADLPEGFIPKARDMFRRVRSLLVEIDKLLTNNRIFYDRLRGLGILSREDALSYGITGPWLRGSGIPHDLRKAEPYFVYDRVEFDIPYGEHGDNFDRYLVRMEEMQQSLRICEQCFEQMGSGPINAEIPAEFIDSAVMVDTAKSMKTKSLIEMEAALSPNLTGQEKAKLCQVASDDKRIAMPPKAKTYSNIEGLMNHFMLVMENYGIRPPQGEAYGAVEAANGELGFYVISDGAGQPFRVRCHGPCFPIMSALAEILEGDMVADIIATFGSVNMIGGELDR